MTGKYPGANPLIIEELRWAITAVAGTSIKQVRTERIRKPAIKREDERDWRCSPLVIECWDGRALLVEPFFLLSDTRAIAKYVRERLVEQVVQGESSEENNLRAALVRAQRTIVRGEQAHPKVTPVQIARALKEINAAESGLAKIAKLRRVCEAREAKRAADAANKHKHRSQCRCMSE